ncbi:HNH endonuclease signature motif containing protein [Microbispora sp. H10670]|uniref:HNH endonuclease signature motif containing protein n=1 Tax=Microbispora sp. H10670 TaxID=2729108 RepID=UPI001600CB67
MGIYINGARLTDLTSYPPGEQPSYLATLDELRAANLWPNQREEPDAFLAWRSGVGYRHLPLYRRQDARRVEPIEWLVDYERQEAGMWAREVLGLGAASAFFAVEPSHCCGRAIDICVMSSNGLVLFDKQLMCPCQKTAGPEFADVAESFFDLAIWDNRPHSPARRISWGMAPTLTLSTEIRLLAEHPEPRFRRWAQLTKGVIFEDAQAWDIYWRCDGECDGQRRFLIEIRTSLDSCQIMVDRVSEMAKRRPNKDLQSELPTPPFAIDPEEPILLPIRLDREDFQRRSKRAEYRYLCQQAEQFEQQGLDPKKDTNDSPRRPRSYYAKRAVILRCRNKCENPNCENPGAPSETTDRGGAILDIDHIDDHAKGGRDHPELMIALCPNCHAVKTRGRSRETLREKLRHVAQERHHYWYGP